jgi:DNA-3-methyladenine glycosylase II
LNTLQIRAPNAQDERHGLLLMRGARSGDYGALFFFFFQSKTVTTMRVLKNNQALKIVAASTKTCPKKSSVVVKMMHVDLTEVGGVEAVLDQARALPVTRGGWSVEAGLAHLISVEPERFGAAIARFGIPKSFTDRADVGDHSGHIIRPPFHALVKTIVYQQLAGSSAEPILRRLLSAAQVPEGGFATPELMGAVVWEVAFIEGKKKIMANGAVPGLSEAKMKALQSLTEHFLDPERLGGAVDMATLTASELRDRLLAVKGLGPWSVNMFQMFELQSPDVYPIGDLGVRRGTQRFYGIPEKDSKAGITELMELTASWSPYSSLGSCYMWKVHDAHKGVKNSV